MKNYYITKDEDENIISIFSRSQYEGQEKLAEDDQEIIDYFTAQETIDELENTRIAIIENEKESAGLRNITPKQAYDKIDQIFEGATTIAQLREATAIVLKKMIPYILR